jgi:hypothetical protein
MRRELFMKPVLVGGRDNVFTHPATIRKALGRLPQSWDAPTFGLLSAGGHPFFR